MPNLAESFLALFAGRTRAAAIMGDLTEMAATRDRGWFWAAYARTLFTLTWRIVLALVAATVGRQILFNFLYGQVLNGPPPTHAIGPWANLINSMLYESVSTLWFVLPFAAVCYGTRDRFVRLATVTALATTMGFWFGPWGPAILFSVPVGIGLAALASTTWRKPALILAGTAAVNVLVMLAIRAPQIYLINLLHAHPHSVLAHYAPMVVFRSSLVGVALVCSRLHRLLLEQPSGTGPTMAAAG